MSALRAAVEWMSAIDTRRMVLTGDRVGILATLRRIHALPGALEHHAVLAEASSEEILAMCDLVEREGTGNPPVPMREVVWR